jgi:hypothetical protein
MGKKHLRRRFGMAGPPSSIPTHPADYVCTRCGPVERLSVAVDVRTGEFPRTLEFACRGCTPTSSFHPATTHRLRSAAPDR